MMASRGYDMTPTMYSPDGRIYQVEYAIETVKRGTLAIGISTKQGVIMAVEEKARTLQTKNITQKIFQVDYHIGVAAAGYIPDARVQVDSARAFSQGNCNSFKIFSRYSSSIYSIWRSTTKWCLNDHCRS
jgi:proteasome alpha subunit